MPNKLLIWFRIKAKKKFVIDSESFNSHRAPNQSNVGPRSLLVVERSRAEPMPLLQNSRQSHENNIKQVAMH